MPRSIADILQNASIAISPLDREVLLAHVLQVSRAYLLAFPERTLNAAEDEVMTKLMAAREEGVPIAYLTGHQEFWSLDFIVTEATLIPRPETELLVELVLEKVQGEQCIIADLGTGSGAIALAIAKERPQWTIYATDASEEALRIAELNATRMGIKNVLFRQGHWCEALPRLKFDAIVSNPPYIACDDPHIVNQSLRYEPQSALVADEGGLSDLKIIIADAKKYLKSGAFLFLEHGYDQAAMVRTLLQKMGYTQIDLMRDLAGLDRVTIASSSVV